MKKAYYRILGILFGFFIFGFYLANMIAKDTTFSDLENRVLAQKPKFSMDNLLEGRFTEKYETYINDQFVLRNNFVSLKSSVDEALGKVENNGIYKGRDDYLLEGFKVPDQELVNENIEAINKFTKKHKDIKSYFLLAPTSSAVLKSNMPSNVPYVDQLDYMNDFGAKLVDVKYINPYATLFTNKDEYIYYKTDHHWTTMGAYYAYTDFCSALKIKAKTLDDYDKNLVSTQFYGTYFSKALFSREKGDDINVFTPKDKNDRYIVEYVEEKEKNTSMYASEYLEKRDKYGMFLKGNHPLVRITTTAKLEKKKKILIFKDSYANSFVPFLTSHYTDITLVDPRYYYGNIEDLIKQDGYDEILYLYNAGTFFSDNSLSTVLNNE